MMVAQLSEYAKDIETGKRIDLKTFEEIFENNCVSLLVLL